MNMKNILFGLFLLTVPMSLSAQFNDYKYIIVPKQFESFKEVNQYNTSTLTKYLLSNYGFNVVYDDALPLDLNVNRCLGLTTVLNDQSNMFTTKVSLQFKDCNNTVVFETLDAKSKIKEYKDGYKEAITKAAQQLAGIGHNYTPKQTETVTLNFKDDVKQLPAASQQEAKDNTKLPVDVEQSQGKEPANSTANITTRVQEATNANVLYAQPLENGYQLIDSTPQIVYVLKSTSAPEVFMVSKDGKNGVVFKDNGQWYVEFDGDKAPKAINIKF